MIVLHFVVRLLGGSMVGVNGDLLQEGLCHKLDDQGSCTQSPCPCGGPLLTHRPSTGDTHTQFWLSLCGVSGSWCTQGLFEPSAFLLDVGFDSKCDFTTSTILLGLLLCPWTWGISSKSLQHHAATTPAPHRCHSSATQP